MATACVALPVAEILGVEYYQQRTRKSWGIEVDDVQHQIEENEAGICTRWRERCDSAYNGCCPSTPSTPTLRALASTSPIYRKAFVLVTEILLSIPPLLPAGEDDSLSEDRGSDLPQPFFDGECLARARVQSAISAPAGPQALEPARERNEPFRDPTMGSPVNLGDSTGIQTRGGKKNKKKEPPGWGNSDNENGAKNEEGGKHGDGGGEGGGANGGGSGGADENGDGAGGNDGDGWNSGGKKNKKNKKKAKQEEEKEKGKDQQDETGKDNNEEDAAAANTLSWANETNDAQMDDEWTSFPKKEKKKRGKKADEEIAPIVSDPPTAFQDVSLDDGAPKIDINFGSSDSQKDTGSGAFAWGKGWSFGSTGTPNPSEKKEVVVDKDREIKGVNADLGGDNPWSNGSKSKGKKNTNVTSGFDFGDIGASQDTPDLNLALNASSNSKPAEEDTGNFFTANKNKKKKGKNVAEEKKEEPNIAPPEALLEDEPEKEVEDSWAYSAGKKKDKKKKGKDVTEDKREEPIIAVTEPKRGKEVDDQWGMWDSAKKDKKKVKNGGTGEHSTVPVSTYLDPVADIGDEWGTLGIGNNDEENGAYSWNDDPGSEKNSQVPAAEPTSAYSWDTLSSKKEKKAKKKDKEATGKGVIEDVPEPPFQTVAEDELPTQEANDIKEEFGRGWGLSAKDKKKKEKEAKKIGATEVVPEPPLQNVKEDELPTHEADDIKEESSWSWNLSAKDKKKKEKEAKKKGVVENLAEPAAQTVEEEETPDGDGIWSWKGSVKKPTDNNDDTPPRAPTPPAQSLTPKPSPAFPPVESWEGFTTTKTKSSTKKGVAGKASQVTDSKTKSKGGKEDKSELVTSAKNEVLPSEKEAAKEETPAKAAKGSWAGLGGITTSTAKGKLAKEKERKEREEKARKDEEERVRKEEEEEEKERIRQEEEEEEERVRQQEEEERIRQKEEEAERARKEGEERVRKEAEEATAALRESKKSTKSKAAGKLTKAEIKANEKAAKKKKEVEKEVEKVVDKDVEEAALIDIMEETSPKEEKTLFSKAKKPTAKTVTDNLKFDWGFDTTNEEIGQKEEKEEKRSDDYFGSWGNSSLKKTSGKKEEKEDESKKEIDNQGWSNENHALDDFPNELEGSKGSKADEPSKPTTTNTTTTTKSSKNMFTATTLTKSKNTASTSVGARIKALEATKKEEKAKAETLLAKEAFATAATAATATAVAVAVAAAAALSTPVEEFPKEEKKKESLFKSKAALASTSKSSKKKEKEKEKEQEKAPSPPPVEKKSKETLPGSFPGAFAEDDDLMALDDLSATVEKKSAKKGKEAKKSTGNPKAMDLGIDDLLMEEATFEAPQSPATEKKSVKKGKETKKTTTGKSKAMDMELEDLLMEAPEAPEPPKLPTPPPEEKKPVKKERARVERSGTGSSWGFWGTAPTPKRESTKKETTKSVEERQVFTPPPKKKSAPAGMVRPKAVKTPKAKEHNDIKEGEKISKSSGSDTKDKRAEARSVKPTRGMSLSAFMMGAPPPSATRAKSTRRSSVAGVPKSTSRRQSMDIDGGSLMSPPPDDYPPIPEKAAKFMGVKSPKLDKTKTVKGKERASVVPDPYPIDDDDMVMVNGLEDPLLNGSSSRYPPPKEKLSKTSKSKRESKTSKPRARTLSNEDDVVMVEAGPSGGEAFVTSGPDDMAFVEHSAPELKRSNTTTKRSTGFFGGFFGGGIKIEKAPEPVVRSRPTSSSYRDERMIDVEPLPARIKDKTKRRSTKPYFADIEAPEPSTISAEAEARRAERRAAREAEELERVERRKSRREKEKVELEERRTKARDRARREQEAEEQRREEKRARRVAREEAQLKENAEADAAAAARREERRRLRAELEASELEKARLAAAAEGQDDVDQLQKSKDDRKQQFEREEAERLRRREAKKGLKSPRENVKARSGQRKSTATSPLMDEYFQSRNGSGSGNTPRTLGGPPDKTSSWVKSQTSDPPDLPPVEGTILDGEKPRSAVPLDDERDRDRVRDRDRDRGGREERRRSSKKEPTSSPSRRHSRYTINREEPPLDADEMRRSSRRKESRHPTTATVEEGEIKSGGGSGGEYADGPVGGDRHKHRSRRRETMPAAEYDAYANAGAGTWVRPSGGGGGGGANRNSILGRFGGFL